MSMALTYKVLGQSAPAAATLTDAYTVPSATYAIINSVVVCNTGSSSTTFRVSVAKNGASDTLAQYVAREVIINGNSTTELALGITMDAADVLRVYSTSGSLSFNAFGVEIV
jgi:hypothetical protein